MLQVALGRGQSLPPGPGEDFCLPPKSDRVLPSVLGKGPIRMVLLSGLGHRE